ncbi:MAG: AraC family transcriptional regulator [Bacteroidales bacterium]
MTELFIKNMVCNRCISVVREIFLQLKLDVADVQLGKVIVLNTNIDKKTTNLALKQHGFELLEDKLQQLVNRVKLFIIGFVQNENKHSQKFKLSQLIEREIGKDYNYISNVFSEMENITIEKYYILQKIEKVKELLIYGELSLNEIADTLNYSSAAHLSNQFKEVTGFTSTQFRKLKNNNRKCLGKV